MRPSQITSRSFRKLSSAAVFFGTGVTLIEGDNAQGKTLPAAGTVLLTSAWNPAPWRRHAAAVVELRAGQGVERPRAVNELWNARA